MPYNYSIEDSKILGLFAPAQKLLASDFLNPCHEHENVISTISKEAIVEAVIEVHVQSFGDSAM